MSSSSNKPAATTNSDHLGPPEADARYHFDSEALQKLRTEAPWMQNPKYFNRVALSPAAIMKIMMHCQSGVEKGIKKGGNPIEVMGLLMGRPDPETPNTLVVADAFPLPIEGFETRVVADDEDVTNHMISLGESLEATRKEKFMGWYHSHPFDLSDHSHCFLSQTDMTTQLQWQRAEDPHGNPFVAIVVDPLRSMHQDKPEIKAFRAYPPDYNSPVANECPNGSIEPLEQLRLEKWGSCWNRYYELELEYFMSATSRKIIVNGLTQDSLWMRTLVRASPQVLAQSLTAASKDFAHATNGKVMSLGGSGGGGLSTSSGEGGSRRMRPSSSSSSSTANDAVAKRTEEWNKAINQVHEVAVEHLAQKTLQETKTTIFGA